jgi:hypothetical protein
MFAKASAWGPASSQNSISNKINTCIPCAVLQASYPSVNFKVVNLAHSGNDVTTAATCWYHLAPTV